MSEKAIYELRPNNRDFLCSMLRDAQDGWIFELGEPTRTKDQNAKMWPMLRDISQQVEYHGQYLSTTEWKDFAVACLKQQKFVPNLDGNGFIVVGGKTSNMSKSLFSDLIEMLYQIGIKFHVEWSDESNMVIDEATNHPIAEQPEMPQDDGNEDW